MSKRRKYAAFIRLTSLANQKAGSGLRSSCTFTQLFRVSGLGWRVFGGLTVALAAIMPVSGAVSLVVCVRTATAGDEGKDRNDTNDARRALQKTHDSSR